jgi:aminoglycoside phosphotransferase (APT) family kinase protein
VPVIEGLPDLASVLEAWGLAGVPEEPLQHDGWSGALLTQLTRPDGARFVLKRDSVERDWIARVTDDHQLREAQLVHANPLMPVPVGFPHIAVATDGDEIAELMPNLTGTLLHWEAPIGQAALDRVLGTLVALHQTPWQNQLPAAFPWTDLRTRVLMLTRPTAARYQELGLPVGARFLQGWDAFDRLVRPPVRALVAELAAHPEPLLAALGRLPEAGLHGDFKIGNAGLDRDGTVWLIDWQLSLVAPIAVELGWFLVSNSASLPLTPEAVLERYRVLAGLDDDDAWLATWDCSVLVGLLLRGWRKGLDTEAGVVYPSGKAAAYDLAWWGSQAIGAAARRL